MNRLRRIYTNPDAQAIAALVLLWLLFFWRLFTPIAADQASLAKGDFSEQFVAFAGYQYQRLSSGEIPLWNPYNNGGLPFIADTQAAVFYPPRWLTIGLSSLTGAWSYNALQLEMTFHVLLNTLLMYAFVRRLTLGAVGSRLAALVSALIIGYCGYTAGYPTLQLAILEAAAWLPLVLLGILEATRSQKTAYRFIALAGFGLGLSWLAGHPQTSFFLTYIAVGYLAWRSYVARVGWRAFVSGFLLLTLVTIGVTAVTLLPGLEYLLLTSREGLGFSVKGNGFPFRDIAQFVFPGSVSQWSPLYVGIPSLFLVAMALRFRAQDSRFWLIVAIVGLLHSLGENSAFYYLTYNLIPGLRFFRGQERAALLVANSLAILAAIGIIAITTTINQVHKRRALRYWLWFSALLVVIALGLLVAWTIDPAQWRQLSDIASRSAIFSVTSYAILRQFIRQPGRIAFQLALVALIAFELFTVNMDHPGTYDPVPHDQQLSVEPPPLVQQVIDAAADVQPFRVDGFRGLQYNFGSLFGVMDVRGISPLWLKGPLILIYADYTDNPLAWELFAVKYVFSGQDHLSVPSQVIGTSSDSKGPVWLHRLEDPRSFARLYYEAEVVDSDKWALELMGDIRYHERDKIVVHEPLTLPLPGYAADGKARVTSFAPEKITIEIDTPENAILSLSLPHYPGWQASLDGQPREIFRAYAGLSALEIPAGAATLTLTFDPESYRIGALLSLATWLGLGLVALLAFRRR